MLLQHIRGEPAEISVVQMYQTFPLIPLVQLMLINRYPWMVMYAANRERFPSTLYAFRKPIATMGRGDWRNTIKLAVQCLG